MIRKQSPVPNHSKSLTSHFDSRPLQAAPEAKSKAKPKEKPKAKAKALADTVGSSSCCGNFFLTPQDLRIVASQIMILL